MNDHPVRAVGMGGRSGSNNYLELESQGRKERLARISYRQLRRGDRLRIVTGGGGGYGDPRRRKLEAVADDLRKGYITPERARADYAVVLGSDGMPDAGLTAALREAAE